MMGSWRPFPTRVAGTTIRVWLLWLGVVAAVTVAMLPFRGTLTQAHVALAYLLVVQWASAHRGRVLGLTLAGLAFLAFDVLFLPPYGTLVVESPLDWFVLAGFLITSVVGAQLFERARAEAESARQRAAEVDRLSALGAETLNAARAEEAVSAVADVIRSALVLDSCAVYLHREQGGGVLLTRSVPANAADRTRGGFAELVTRVAESGWPAAIRSTGVIDMLPLTPSVVGALGGLGSDVQELVIPLRVRERVVGVLCLARYGGFALEPAQRRFLGALAYYAALGVERVRLLTEAEHADALREAARVKDSVIASVSHDLRTPLTTIKAVAHELAAGGDERAATIEEEAERLNLFVSNLLDLSRLNSGTSALVPEPNEAEDLLGAVLQRVGGAVNGHEIRITLDEGEPLLFGRFDFAQTLRALVNLVENALKYSPRGQPIELAVRRDGEWLAFSVADRGPGVPASERERIFEPFYRRAGSRADVGGAGLGLSIARAAAKAQGGSLRYDAREGGGSIFTLQVPAVDVEAMADR